MGSEDFIISSRSRDIGGFQVHRSLPSPEKRQLGPYVFLDHMGPVRVDSQHAMDVRPHPHIGLATVTYLFEGRGIHRDSLGNTQEIKPGDLNWMTAGRGIVHSERTAPEDRQTPSRMVMNGVQIWVALPREHEECDPSFVHWPESNLPKLQLNESIQARLMLGQYKNLQSPVEVKSRTLFMDLKFDKKFQGELQFEEQELGLFLINGLARVQGLDLEPDDLAVVANPKSVQIEVSEGARIIVIGGESFAEPRYIWWNFVSSRKERIREAAEAWKNQKMGQVVDETEFIPLPDTPLPS